jgi:hypothetical protein
MGARLARKGRAPLSDVDREARYNGRAMEPSKQRINRAGDVLAGSKP